MNISFQRKIDRYIGAFICRIFSLFYHKSRDEDDGFQPKRFLVILLSEMGSLVLAYPMFQQIKERYPGAELYGLLFDKNKEILKLLDRSAVTFQTVLTKADKVSHSSCADAKVRIST